MVFIYKNRERIGSVLTKGWKLKGRLMIKRNIELFANQRAYGRVLLFWSKRSNLQLTIQEPVRSRNLELSYNTFSGCHGLFCSVQIQNHSVLDMAEGFFQISLDPGTKDRIGFVTHQGVYEFYTVPFCLMKSISAFSMVMNEVLETQ